MTNSSPPHRSFNHEQIAQLISRRVARTHKEEVLDVYQKLLQTIWSHILPTLGQVAVTVIGEQAQALAQEKHPVMRHLRVTLEGVSFEGLQEHLDEVEIEALHEAFKDLIANLIEILTTLTGNVLVQKVIVEIERITAANVEEERHDD